MNQGLFPLLFSLAVIFSTSANANYFSSPMKRQAYPDRSIGGIQYSVTKTKVPLEIGEGQIRHTTVTAPWYFDRSEWFTLGLFLAYTYDGETTNIKTQSSPHRQSFYGLGTGIDLGLDHQYSHLVIGGKLGYSVAYESGGKDSLRIITEEPMTRIFLRWEQYSLFMPSLAFEFFAPKRAISYPMADSVSEKLRLPSRSGQAFYLGFISAFEQLDIGLGLAFGDRQGIYITIMNKPQAIYFIQEEGNFESPFFKNHDFISTFIGTFPNLVCPGNSGVRLHRHIA